jgi:hypothetical protein
MLFSFLFFSFLFCFVMGIPASESRDREAMNRRGVHETVQDRAGLFEASSFEEPQNDRRYLADRLGGLAVRLAASHVMVPACSPC